VHGLAPLRDVTVAAGQDAGGGSGAAGGPRAVRVVRYADGIRIHARLALPAVVAVAGIGAALEPPPPVAGGPEDSEDTVVEEVAPSLTAAARPGPLPSPAEHDGNGVRGRPLAAVAGAAAETGPGLALVVEPPFAGAEDASATPDGVRRFDLAELGLPSEMSARGPAVSYSPSRRPTRRGQLVLVPDAAALLAALRKQELI
jgi:hypothetical protein